MKHQPSRSNSATRNSFFLLLLAGLLYCMSSCSGNEEYSLDFVIMEDSMPKDSLWADCWKVTLTNREIDTLFEARTDTEGRIHFEGLKRGWYCIQTYPGEVVKYRFIHSNVVLDTIWVEAPPEPEDYDFNDNLRLAIRNGENALSGDFYHDSYVSFLLVMDAIPYQQDTIKGYGFIFDDSYNYGQLLNPLQGVRMKSHRRLSIQFEGSDAAGICRLIAKKDTASLPLLENIKADFTPKGIWSAFLLWSAPSFLPTWWHGGYLERSIVFDVQDLLSLPTLTEAKSEDCVAFKKALSKHPSPLRPRITITSATEALLELYWYNDWEGVYMERIPVTMKNGVINFTDKGDRHVIVPYECDIQF